jgi:competence protein ComEA
MTSRLWLVPGWRRLLPLLLPPALGAGVLATVFAFSPSPLAPAAIGPPAPQSRGGASPAMDALPQTGGLLVQVSGAVAHPGLYRVAKGDRVSAAVAAAGGLTGEADPNKLPNLAARLRDGQEVKVPTRSSAATGRTTRQGKASLNSASEDELAAIPGFSRELAAAAVRYRQEYGGFATTRELVTVLGMGEADYLVARSYISL